jgi:hypothetical protein
MKNKLKRCVFSGFVAAMRWGLMGGENFLHTFGIEPDFDRLGVMEFEASRALVRKAIVDSRYDNPSFPYVLNVKLNLVTGDKKESYRFYSDKNCKKPLKADTLVTINGNPPGGVSYGISSEGGFEVYLDSLPPEGALVIFSQGWFFAQKYSSVDFIYRKKVKILTESIPLEKDASLGNNILH